jgi:hypothetical protein
MTSSTALIADGKSWCAGGFIQCMNIDARSLWLGRLWRPQKMRQSETQIRLLICPKNGDGLLTRTSPQGIIRRFGYEK